MTINTINDTLLLSQVKQHLQVDSDVTDDDSIIQIYISNSLAYVTNYTGNAFEAYNVTETFNTWENDIIQLQWNTEVKEATITYTDSVLGVQTIDVTVYADNLIIEAIPVNYNGGVISVNYVPYVNTFLVPTSHQARLLIIGDWYTNRENTITGTTATELNNTGANAILNSLNVGVM